MKKLLVIDVQKQFKDNKGMYEKCISFLSNCKDNYDTVYVTVFSQTIDGSTNNNFVNKLDWHRCGSCSEADLEFDTSNMYVINKNGYGIKNLDTYINPECDQVDIIGCNIDACVMAVCFQLWDMGVDFRVLTDYVYTTSSRFAKDDVKEILKSNFGTCVI